MANKPMSGMPTDSSIAGTERMLAQGADGSVILVSAIAAYVIDQLVAAAAVTPTAGDALLVERAGAEGTFDLDALVTYVLNAAFDSAAVTTTASGDLFVLERSGVRKRITIDNLSASILDGAQATILNLAALDAATPGTDDLFLFNSGTTPKKITRSNLETQLWADFATYVSGLGEDTLVTGNDKLYVIQGGTPKWVDPAALATYFDVPEGDVTGPVTTTENNIPQWDATTKLLKDGLGLRTTVRASGAGASDSYVPTEQAVAEFVGVITALDIDGASDIGEALADADLLIVDNGGVGNNVKCAMTRIFSYVEDAIQALTAKTTPIDADILLIQDSAASDAMKELTVANLWDNRYLADAKAIKLDEFTAGTDVTTLNATTSVHGLLLKATAPAANTLNVVGIANGETAYTNKTLFDATNPAALGTAGPGTAVVAAHRDHVHALPTLDGLAVPTDVTTLNATTGLHGLLPKLGGGTTNFLRADGTWAAPAGSAWAGDIADINLDGGTDIGADLADADLILVDDGAGGTNRKAVMSRVKTYADKQKTATYSSGQTLSAAECNGYVVYVTGAATIVLPAVAEGMSVTIITIGNVAVSVDPNASDKIWLDGVALDDGDKITNASTAGDIAVLTYYSADGWHASTNSWTDGA